MIEQTERLKRKLQEYYFQERDKGIDLVTAKYNASYYITLYLLGIVEHYSEWEDMSSIKSALQNYRSLELFSYDRSSTELLEKEYQAYITQKKSS